MREIKFRGKRIFNGQWVYGVPVETSLSGVYMVSSKAQTKGGRGGVVIRDVVVQHQVDHATVGQYTGVDDTDETELFEGDIVKFEYEGAEYTGVIKFEAGAFIVACNDLLDSYVSMLEIIQFDGDTCWIDGKVVGNIHDNPELLTGGTA